MAGEFLQLCAGELRWETFEAHHGSDHFGMALQSHFKEISDTHWVGNGFSLGCELSTSDLNCHLWITQYVAVPIGLGTPCRTYIIGTIQQLILQRCSVRVP